MSGRCHAAAHMENNCISDLSALHLLFSQVPSCLAGHLLPGVKCARSLAGHFRRVQRTGCCTLPHVVDVVSDALDMTCKPRGVLHTSMNHTYLCAICVA